MLHIDIVEEVIKLVCVLNGPGGIWPFNYKTTLGEVTEMEQKRLDPK
jgi:hypothetical protein